MITARSEIIIERPADAIWIYAADILRHPEWMTVQSAETLQGTGTQVGDRGRERIRLGPISRDAEFTVVSAEPGRRIAWRTGAGSPLHGELVLALEPLGGSSTRARYGGSFTGYGLMRLIEPLVSGEVRAGVEKELCRLKEVVEAEGRATA